MLPRCPFEKSLLSGHATCELAEREYTGERTGVVCQVSEAKCECQRLLDSLRRNARFALKIHDAGAPLPFGKEMKVMFGGLLGLQRVVNGETHDRATVGNVHVLVQAAGSRPGGVDGLPYSEIMRSVTVWTSPRRSGKSK
jgi:hypothetical protein